MTERERKWKLYKEACDWVSPIPFNDEGPQCYTVEKFVEHFSITKEEAIKLINKLVEDKKLGKTAAENIYISVRICDICGKHFDDLDLQEINYHYHHFGFGSKYDLKKIEFDVCVDCFDKIVDTILPLFPKSPLKDQDIYQDEACSTICIQTKSDHDNDPF